MAQLLCAGDYSYFEHNNICLYSWKTCSQGMEWIKGGGIFPGLETDLNLCRGK